MLGKIEVSDQLRRVNSAVKSAKLQFTPELDENEVFKRGLQLTLATHSGKAAQAFLASGDNPLRTPVMTRYVLATLLTTVSAIAIAAEPIEPCSLLSAADLAELGVPADAARSTEKQPGGVLYCKYQAPSTSTSVSSASVILSTAVPDRAQQVRAMLNKALSENNPAQLEARGEYFVPNATCKVVSVSQLETSQCLGTTQQSVVGLTLVRVNKDDKVVYPALQLRLISRLVSSVGERGG